jgi:ferritin-like metal-binding protein YciE
MSAPESLKDLYLEELRDLWSANDQMKRLLPKLSAEAGDKLRVTLDKAVSGIQEHTDIVKSLIEENGGETSKEHCKGMEGLVKEAEKHALDEEIEDDDVRDAVILSQYQRMCHYGLAGFGTAAAYAKALGLSNDEQRLKKTVSEIYKGDEAATHLAENAVNLAAKHAAAA